jgi:hypothetical protein
MNLKTRESTSRISIKALLLSNAVFLAALVSGIILVVTLGFAAAKLTAAGTAASLEQIMSSPMVIGGWLMVGSLICPLLAGYTAASIAPRDKLLNGVLSVLPWIVFSICCDIWTPDDGLMPRWLDLLSSYWVPLPALAGAYICQWRAMRPAVAAAA